MSLNDDRYSDLSGCSSDESDEKDLGFIDLYNLRYQYLEIQNTGFFLAKGDTAGCYWYTKGPRDLFKGEQIPSRNLGVPSFVIEIEDYFDIVSVGLQSFDYNICWIAGDRVLYDAINRAHGWGCHTSDAADKLIHSRFTPPYVVKYPKISIEQNLQVEAHSHSGGDKGNKRMGTD